MRAWLTPALLLAALTSAATPAHAAEAGPQDWWKFLDRDATGAAAFTRAHPEWDGRGVVIAVLDTGVDPSVKGLLTTSTGEQKVIETRDFSGEGTVKLSKPRALTEEGVAVLRLDDPARAFVLGHDHLPVKPGDGAYYLGVFDEKRLKNSEVTDLDLDGQPDQFAVLAFIPAGQTEPVVVVDTDGDHDLSDEKVRKSYRDEPKWFRFANPDPRKNQHPVAVTVTVVFDGDDKHVELHFDDGGHGSHCAGIASGHSIQGRDGFDGIAPGAKVMSLKIGDNTNAGGATTPGSKKRALEYAAKWARDHDVPVIISMSYGVGAEVEGAGAIDHLMDQILQSTPNLAASVAAGNEGPGISTVGMPGGSKRAFTSGALLTKRNAETLYGGKIPQDRIFVFSSRGGELNKPDAVAPGVAWSTVPPFLHRSIMQGTSMATPQSSGVHALLVSAALATKTAWNAALVKQAIRATAKPVKGYTPLDYGAGLIHVPSAWKALKDLAKTGWADKLAGWDVSTAVPQRPGALAAASYWRVGGYVPEYPEQVEFTVGAAFFDQVPAAERQKFFETLSVSSDAGWLSPNRSTIAVRQGDVATLKARVDRRALKKPGVYVGRLHARASGTSYDAFVMPVVVVIPHRFADPELHKRRFVGTLAAAEIARVFIEVPPGATSMALRFDVPEGRFGQNYLEVHDPAGRPYVWGSADSQSKDAFEKVVSGAELRPGIWEAVAYSTFRNRQPSHWRLDVSFSGLEVNPKVTYDQPKSGGPEATVAITNRFATPFVGKASAKVLGMGQHHELAIKGPEESLSVPVGAGISRVTLDMEVSREDYAKFTDIAVMVLDSGGTAVAKGGFGKRFSSLSFGAKEGSYTVKIVGATAVPDDELRWTVKIHEVHRYASPVPLDVTWPGGMPIALYPGVKTSLTLTGAAPLREIPKDMHHVAVLELVRREDGTSWLKLPLELSRP